ncbi:unnamed protein product, partial [marine sediment metagenome]
PAVVAARTTTLGRLIPYLVIDTNSLVGKPLSVV